MDNKIDFEVEILKIHFIGKWIMLLGKSKYSRNKRMQCEHKKACDIHVSLQKY